MYKEFLMGVMCGFLIGVYVFMLSDLLARSRYKEDKKKTVQKTTKTPEIYEEHYDPVSIVVKEYVPFEEFEHINDEWYKRKIIEKLKLRMIETIWELVTVEKSLEPYSFENVYVAKLKVLAPYKKAFVHKCTKQE